MDDSSPSYIFLQIPIFAPKKYKALYYASP